MLSRKKDSEGTWYPVAIGRYEALLERVIQPHRGYRHDYALRKNIAYNLQYIEFLHRCLHDLKISSAIEKQILKNLIIVGCGVIESLLHFLLTAAGHHKQTDWDRMDTVAGNPTKINGQWYRFDILILKKLPSLKTDKMTFDSMLKCAEKKGTLGSDLSVYAKLNRLRQLRNRIHLQEIGNPLDTDWNAIKQSDLLTISSVLHAVFIGPIFQPTDEQCAYFDYLLLKKTA
jgi:hypothetical protein